MAIATNSGSPPSHFLHRRHAALHRRHAALHFCDNFFPHCGFSRDGCVMPSDGSSDSSAMLPPLEPSLQMIPWYPAIGPESETPVDASRGNRCGTQAAHSPEPAQPTGTLRTTNPSICRHASVTCPGRRRAWLRNDAPRCLFRNATPLLVLQFQQFVGECRRGYAGTYPSKAADYGQ